MRSIEKLLNAVVPHSWLRAFSCDSRFPEGSSSVDLPLHVPIVPMSVKIPVAPMLYIETSFEPEFVT